MRGGPRKKAGRPPGVRNKKTAEKLAEIEASGETPLEYMLRVMRDPRVDKERRDRLAQGAAPYVHAKLASIEHAGPDGGAIPIHAIIEQVIVDP